MVKKKRPIKKKRLKKPAPPAADQLAADQPFDVAGFRAAIDTAVRVYDADKYTRLAPVIVTECLMRQFGVLRMAALNKPFIEKE